VQHSKWQQSHDKAPEKISYKSSEVAEMGDRLATIDNTWAEKWGGAAASRIFAFAILG